MWNCSALHRQRALLASAGVYIVGEVVTYNVTVHRGYNPPLSGLLNFPVSTHLRTIFSPEAALSMESPADAQGHAS